MMKSIDLRNGSIRQWFVMRIPNRIIKQAKKEAEKSNVRSAKVGAILFYRGHKHLAAHNMTVHGNKLTIHAEKALVDKIEKTMIIQRHPDKQFSILVVRAMRNGELCIAKPCDKCQKVLDKLGIDIYYSNEFGYIEQLK